jgi:NADH-quinone oxidoreductase subunit L
MNPNLLLAIPLLPLAAAVIAGLFGGLLGRTASATLTIAGVLGALLLSLKVFQQLAFEGVPSYNDTVYTWLVSDGIRMQVGFLVDHLTVLMMVVVSENSRQMVRQLGIMSHDFCKRLFKKR